MIKRAFILIPLVLISCHTDSLELDKVQTNIEQDDQPEISDTLLFEESTINDLNPLKECILHATFKSPIIACLDDFETELEEADPFSVDTVFEMTVSKMFELADQVYFDDERDLVKGTWELKPELVNKYKTHGFKIDQEEGIYFITPDDQFLSSRFREIVSPSMVKYLDFRLKNPTKISYDAGLSMGWMDFAERLVTEEKLLSGNSPVVFAIVSEELISESTWFLIGMDNTPIYDWESYEIRPDYKRALEFLRLQGGPYLKKIAEKQFNYFKNRNWIYDTNTENIVINYKQAKELFDQNYSKPE